MTIEIQELMLSGGLEEKQIPELTVNGVPQFSVKAIHYGLNVQPQLCTMATIEIRIFRTGMDAFAFVGDGSSWKYTPDGQLCMTPDNLWKLSYLGNWSKRAFVRMFEVWGKANSRLFERGFLSSLKLQRSFAGLLGTAKNGQAIQRLNGDEWTRGRDWSHYAYQKFYRTNICEISPLSPKGVESCRQFAREQAKGKVA